MHSRPTVRECACVPTPVASAAWKDEATAGTAFQVYPLICSPKGRDSLLQGSSAGKPRRLLAEGQFVLQVPQ